MKNLNELNIKFVQKRKIWYIISLLIIIPGIISLFAQSLNFGIDFTGGNLLQIQFTQNVEIADVREVVNDYTDKETSIQSADNIKYSIRTAALTAEAGNQLLDALENSFGEFEILSNEFIGPIIGQELLKNALMSLAIAMVLMLIYIAFRFKIRFSLAAILALCHDALVTICIFSLLQIEVNSVFVAAILTVVGYSINNTIVVFDRIRENMERSKKYNFIDTVNLSINQTITRSVNTVLAVLFFLLSILFFGGESTKVFALAMTIGILAGTYSSMCLAGSFLVDFRAGGSNNYKPVQKINNTKIKEA